MKKICLVIVLFNVMPIWAMVPSPQQKKALLKERELICLQSADNQKITWPNCLPPRFYEGIAHEDIEPNADSCTVTVKCKLPYATIRTIAPSLSNYISLSQSGQPINMTYHGLSAKVARKTFAPNSPDYEPQFSKQVLDALSYFRLPIHRGIEHAKEQTVLEQAKALIQLESSCPVSSVYKLLDQEIIALTNTPHVKKQSESVVMEDYYDQINPEPGPEKQRTFSVLSEYERRHHELDADAGKVLDIRSIQDLKLIRGSDSDRSKSVAAALSRTSTKLGKGLLYRRLICPTDNQALLEQQKKAVQLFKGISQSDFNDLKRLLHDLNNDVELPEDHFLSLWGTPERPDAFTKFYLKPEEFKLGFKALNDWLNTNQYAVQIFKESDKMAYVAICKGNTLIGKAKLNLENVVHDFKIEREAEVAKKTLSLTGLALPVIKFALYVAAPEWARIPLGIVDSTINSNAEAMRDAILIRYILHKKLVRINSYLKKKNEINTILERNPDLLAAVPALKNLDDRALTNSIHSTATNTNIHFNEFLNTLKTFTDDEPSILSLGEVMVTYRRMDKYKDRFLDTLGAVAELDMMVSLASLMRDSAAHPNSNGYCIPNFIYTSSHPVINIKGSYHPMLDSNKAVPNDLEIGTEQVPEQNVMVTGANGCGKSTAISAAVEGIASAQSLGVCPAQSALLTPFSIIRTYANIIDDIAHNQSSFIGQGTRVIGNFLDAKINPGFSFTVFDEPLNGTEARAAKFLAAYLTAHLAREPRNINVLITHFHEIAEFLTPDPQSPKQPPAFARLKTYKVEAQENNGTIQSDHKLKPGIAIQTFAFAQLRQILRQIISNNNLSPNAPEIAQINRLIKGAENEYHLEIQNELARRQNNGQ